jgi:putative SOS response-associated peptidase YedK
MCNSYNVQAKVGAKELAELISSVIDQLPSSLVRRCGPGVVLTGRGNELKPEIMRWAFEHPKYKAVNNARASSLKSPYWTESLRERRCIVPISRFYEWEESSSGRTKKCFEFSRPDGEWMWIAGIYQEFPSHGNCYATITTDPAPAVAAIHDRMPAVMDWDVALAFLAKDFTPSAAYQGEVSIHPCESPLRRQRDFGQGELF